MVFFSKNEAVVKIKSVGSFFEVLNVSVVVVSVAFIIFAWIVCNYIYISFSFLFLICAVLPVWPM